MGNYFDLFPIKSGCLAWDILSLLHICSFQRAFDWMKISVMHHESAIFLICFPEGERHFEYTRIYMASKLFVVMWSFVNAVTSKL